MAGGCEYNRDHNTWSFRAKTAVMRAYIQARVSSACSMQNAFIERKTQPPVCVKNAAVRLLVCMVQNCKGIISLISVFRVNLIVSIIIY